MWDNFHGVCRIQKDKNLHGPVITNSGILYLLLRHTIPPPPRGNKSYLVLLRAANAATCGNDVEDAWFPLLTGRIARPTHDSPIVHLCHRRIRQIGMRRAGPTRNSGCSVAGLGYVDRLRRVVEGPLEAVGWRVCLYLAYHVSIFVARYTVHALLVLTTDRFVCEQQIVQCNKLKHVPGWRVGPQNSFYLQTSFDI
jgi:hypothetical protein